MFLAHGYTARPGYHGFGRRLVGFLTLNPLPSASGLRPVILGRSVQWFVTPTCAAGLDFWWSKAGGYTGREGRLSANNN